MELSDLEAALEGVLFAAGEPVAVERLCLGLEVDRPTLDEMAQKLADQYSPPDPLTAKVGGPDTAPAPR